PFMLPESADALADPFEPLEEPEPEPVLRKCAPDATASQIVNGSARDLSDIISLLIARQRVAVGYAADEKSINQAVQLTRSLHRLAAIIHLTEATSRAKLGRPRKPRLPKHPDS